MAIDFPASPTNGQLFNASNGGTYQWNGTIWLPIGNSTATIYVGDTPPASPIANQFWFNSALGQTFVWYNDGNTSQWVPASPAATASPIPVTRIQWFGANGTYTPHAAMVSGYVVGKGGGGAGGGGVVAPTWVYGTGGGAEGNTVTTYFVRSQVIPTVAVTVAAGGASVSGADGTNGGDTIFGSLITAKGGGGGNQYVGGIVNNVGNIGNLLVYGAPGGSGMGTPTNTIAVSASGGGAGGGRGAANGGPAGSTAIGSAGLANSGGGGAGGVSFQAGPGNISGAAGGSGYLYVVEYCSA